MITRKPSETERVMRSTLVRELLDGWQAGVRQEGEVYWSPCVYSSEHAAELHANGLSILSCTHDPYHRPFVSDCGQVDDQLVDDYIADYGEPEAKVLPGLRQKLGVDIAIQAAMGVGDPIIGGWQATFEVCGLTFWTHPFSRTKLGAQVNAIAMWFVLGEMFEPRRPEPAQAVRYSPDEEILLRVEVTRGPEIRVYRVPGHYREAIDACFAATGTAE